MKVNKILIAGTFSALIMSGGAFAAGNRSHDHSAETMPAQAMSQEAMSKGSMA